MALLSQRTSDSTDRKNKRRAEVERRIIDATRELLDEGQAYADLSVGRIASKAGLSRSTFYDYFDDKRTLLLGLATDLTHQLEDDSSSWPASELTGPDQLQQLLTGISLLFTSHASATRAIMEAASYDEEIDRWWRTEHIRTLIEAVQFHIEAVSAELDQDRRLPPDSVPAVASALVWMIQQTFYQEVLRGDGHSTEEIVTGLTEVVLRVVLAEPVGSQ
jgi:AcrR family transcriptional regulator